MANSQPPAGRRQRPNHHGRPVRTLALATERKVTTFPVVKKVHYQQAQAVPRHVPGRLSPGIMGLVGAVGVGAVAVTVALVGSCNSAAHALPCPVPTQAGATTLPSATPITCTTSSGSHYVWVHGGGGWVPSRD